MSVYNTDESVSFGVHYKPLTITLKAIRLEIKWNVDDVIGGAVPVLPRAALPSPEINNIKV